VAIGTDNAQLRIAMNQSEVGLLLILVAGAMKGSFTLPMKFTRHWTPQVDRWGDQAADRTCAAEGKSACDGERAWTSHRLR
jgi:hypothetical protein